MRARVCSRAQEKLEADHGGKRTLEEKGFAAFGRVVKGMEVVRKINAAPAKEQTLAPGVRILGVRRK
jgi:peptidyl-prolyl cis-trans isomerase A (cyclophilin A)